MATEPKERGAAGWYPDPEQAATVRYWDGSGWTEQRAPATQPAAPEASGEITMRAVLGGAGAVAVAVSLFLPKVDSATSLHIADNSVFAQSAIAGVIALVVAVAAGVRAVEARNESGVDSSLIILGALVIAGAIYGGTGKRTELETTGPLIGGHHFQGSPGIGIYLLGVGGLLVAVAGIVGGGADSEIPEGAPVEDPERAVGPTGHHPLDPDAHGDEDRPHGWYVIPESPWNMRYWDGDGWSKKTQKTPKETQDGWWKVRASD